MCRATSYEHPTSLTHSNCSWERTAYIYIARMGCGASTVGENSVAAAYPHCSPVAAFSVEASKAPVANPTFSKTIKQVGERTDERRGCRQSKRLEEPLQERA